MPDIDGDRFVSNKIFVLFQNWFRTQAKSSASFSSKFERNPSSLLSSFSISFDRSHFQGSRSAIIKVSNTIFLLLNLPEFHLHGTKILQWKSCPPFEELNTCILKTLDKLFYHHPKWALGPRWFYPRNYFCCHIQPVLTWATQESFFLGKL